MAEAGKTAGRHPLPVSQVATHDYVTDMDYNGYKVNLEEYGESREQTCKKGKKKGETKTT